MPTRSRLSSHRRSLLEGRAASMRHAATPSEAALWRALAGRKLGVLFRRQVVLLAGRVIADFFAAEVGLIVEVDRGYHGRQRARDERRDRALSRAGYRVLRLEAELVHRDLPGAVERIRQALALAETCEPR